MSKKPKTANMSLTELLQHYDSAFKEEQANAEDPQQVQAEKELKELLPMAFTKIAHLIEHADSEAIQANLSKFVVSECLKGFKRGDQDEIESIIAQLRAKPAPTEEEKSH